MVFQITVADLVLYNLTDILSVMFTEMREQQEWVRMWLSHMNTDEGLKNYMENRPPMFDQTENDPSEKITVA